MKDKIKLTKDDQKKVMDALDFLVQEICDYVPEDVLVPDALADAVERGRELLNKYNWGWRGVGGIRI